ncbi:DUF721 domain-containing protein [Thalassobius vesicularis]|uniref:DUF721 domain-containing protein n=1 Tax=Thalassobius vesicularis TaxID=1294297 RepID=A0A4S3MG15_9RHOB|nr:DUF721 domain-containing protein [Thalassobius vesicularis]THD76684.1 DUF721 domain-containing protein [Thalassobius vesicularis]
MATRHSTTKGFARTSSLLQARIRKAGESRGFAVTRLLTHWPEVVGEDIAAIARPVEVKYGRQGLGATLTLLTTGAQAPMLEMQKDRIREKVNATYGYNAISRIRITQTAPTGFAEGQAAFTYRQKEAPKAPDPQVVAEAQALAQGTTDDALRQALEALARNVLSKSKR